MGGWGVVGDSEKKSDKRGAGRFGRHCHEPAERSRRSLFSGCLDNAAISSTFGHSATGPASKRKDAGGRGGGGGQGKWRGGGREQVDDLYLDQLSTANMVMTPSASPLWSVSPGAPRLASEPVSWSD